MPLTPAVRLKDDHTCPSTRPKPHVHGPVTKGSSNVRTNGLGQARIGDPLRCDGVPTTDKIVTGALMVRVNGKPAARVGESSQHGGKLVAGSPNVNIGGPSVALLGTSGAPDAISIDDKMCKQFKDMMKQSFPKGASQEFGSTLTSDASGATRSVNPGAGTSGTFSPNRNVPSGQSVFGIFHTHPYSAAEGGYTNVSLSGGDAGYMINKGDSFIMAQSGAGQFAFVRTAATPAIVDALAMNNAANARIGALMGQGHSFDEASRMAAREVADANGLAYYEGKDCVLQKVN